MNLCKFLLIFTLIALTITCSNTQSLSLPAKTDELVLEVITNAGGSAYPKEGDILQMRLYESGRFEYDDFPDYNPPKASSYNVVIKRKDAQLNPEDAKELIDLTEQSDFLSAKEKYSSLHRHDDTHWITTIKFAHKGKEKKIVAENFWDTQYHQEDKLNYPSSMVKLLERVEQLKAKAIGRTSTQWLASPSNKSAQ